MSRPRGYARWNPSDEAAATIGAVQEVLRTYADYLPMTSRQIFYRLVAAYSYPKTERAYKTLCERLVRARRAMLIPFSAIRDDEISVNHAGGGYSGPTAFWDSLRDKADYYGRPEREGQDWSIELWVESGGMTEMVHQMVYEYGVPVYSSGGFLSVTATHGCAQRALRDDRKRVVLSVGDFDPSGVAIYDALREDALHFYVGEKANDGGSRKLADYDEEFTFERIALTEDQVDELGIETAPPKASDTRSRNWPVSYTAQAEALDPPTLQGILTEAIERYTDLDLLAEVSDRSAEERAEIRETLQGLVDGRDD